MYVAYEHPYVQIILSIGRGGKNDKVKEDDALAHLSNQLLILSKRIRQLERKQMI